ncbi:hypothetical protein NMY22_g13448 [Coprinellus aureogranulatus]|nr:hypothetical protein NMY22_g13448 [Coprinellus aureogranulatus]
MPATATQQSSALSFSARYLDLKLKQVQQAHPEQSLPSPPSSNGASSPAEESYFRVRSLEECLHVYESSSRSKSESLALLSDEEVILLADNGKIAPHALEKLFGMGELERAVRIRRAIISRSSPTKTLESSTIRTRTTITLEFSVHVARTSSDTSPSPLVSPDL